jgi:hypothetical protein
MFAEPYAAAAEMLDKVAHGQQRLRRATAIACTVVAGRNPHLTSIADRRPSERRLDEIEVTKIITPGSAATMGWT